MHELKGTSKNKARKWQYCLAKPGATGFAQAALSKSNTSPIKSH
jgi:hypothetical protein